MLKVESAVTLGIWDIPLTSQLRRWNEVYMQSTALLGGESTCNNDCTNI